MSEKLEMILLRNYTHQNSKIHIHQLKEFSRGVVGGGGGEGGQKLPFKY